MPSAAKGETATVPSAAVGETTAGVAVEAAVVAILARSMGPEPITERGEEDIPGQAARTVGRRPQRSWRGQWDPSRSRSGAERESKPVGEDGAAVEDTAVVGASKPITAGDVQGRAGHGPERASVPITAGDEAPGPGPAGGTRCAVCRRAGPRIPARRGEREREPHARCALG